METKDVITGKNIVKAYKDFTLSIPELSIPQGFTTTLVGENGAGKSTLLKLLAGIKKDYSGDITYFNRSETMESGRVKSRIGFTADDSYYFENWRLGQIRDMYGILFDDFRADEFDRLMTELDIPSDSGKKVSELSAGNRMKLELAGALARNTDLLILDEPASPLDPLMRTKLNELLQHYLEEKDDRSVLVSTHNILDMESITDYTIILEHGKVVEQGFVPDLKEKYISVRGDSSVTEEVRPFMYFMSESSFGFEGIMLADGLDKVAGFEIETAEASLSDICVAVMTHYSNIKIDR